MRVDRIFLKFQAQAKDTLRSLSMILTAVFMLTSVFTFSLQAYSEDVTIRLFNENGKITSDYNKQVLKIKELVEKNQLPITVQFSKGLSFRVYDVQSGTQNLILDVGEGKVLRIRLFSYTPFRFWNSILNPRAMIDSIGNYISGYKTLTQNKIPVPLLTIFPGHEKEFLMIEKSTGKLVSEFLIIMDCANKFWLCDSAISRCLKGKRKSHKGYVFIYKDEKWL